MYTSKRNYILMLCMCIFIMSSCKKELYKTEPDIFAEDTGFKVVGYLPAGDFDRLDELELDRLTYLNLAFANPDPEGNLIFSRNTDIKQAVKKGHEAGLKVLVSLAGGGRPDAGVWKSVLKPSRRKVFIKGILDFVEENDLDGVDVDIEGNLLPTIRELYNPFVIELKKALHARGKTITTALGGAHIHESISQEALDAYDYINIMVYDRTGPWRPERIGQHSSYSYAEEAVEFWTREKKIPPEKIVLGMPFYGWNFTTPVGSKVYRQVVKDNPADAYLDQVEQLYYNGIPTIVKKTQLAKEKVDGVMFWQIAQDTVCDLSLLRAVHQTIQAGDCNVKTFFKDSDGDGYGDLKRPYQACEAPEGYVENRDDPDDTDPEVKP